jgi:hypothetical protein
MKKKSDSYTVKKIRAYAMAIKFDVSINRKTKVISLPHIDINELICGFASIAATKIIYYIAKLVKSHNYIIQTIIPNGERS